MRAAHSGIFLHRSSHLLAGILGVLKAGGAYVPLDPAYPASRLSFIIEDTKMPVVVTQRSFVRYLPPTKARVIVIDDLSPEPVNGHPGSPPAPSNLAYVIYTSGSTGQPKGVCVEHRCLLPLVAWARQLYTLAELNGVLFATAATFDVSIFESLVPLCLGGKIILAETIFEMPSLPAVDEVRLISGVPSAVAELVRTNRLPASVRTVNVAGEPWPQVAEAIFSPRELARLRACPLECRRTEFFEGWTRQEAVLKAAGCGFGGAITDQLESGFSVYPLRPAAGFAGALAVRPNVAWITLQRWQEPWDVIQAERSHLRQRLMTLSAEGPDFL